AVRKGGNSGPAVVPGKASDSLLIRAVSGADGVEPMPPKGPRLGAPEVALLRAWIDQGARVPDNETVTQTAGSRKHWAFQPIRRPIEPSVRRSDWSRNPIDRFILTRLE